MPAPGAPLWPRVLELGRAGGGVEGPGARRCLLGFGQGLRGEAGRGGTGFLYISGCVILSQGLHPGAELALRGAAFTAGGAGWESYEVLLLPQISEKPYLCLNPEFSIHRSQRSSIYA